MSSGSPVPPSPPSSSSSPPPALPPLPPLGPDAYAAQAQANAQHQQPQPIPVQQLSYATAQHRRPGLVTAIGILSIVFAVPGILGGGCVGAYSGIFFASMGFAMRVAPTPAPAPTVQEVTEPTFTAEERQVIGDAMTAIHPLSDQRRQLLDVLLSKAGEDMFPAGSQPLSESAVRTLVTDAGPTSDGQSDYFLLGRGRIEIDDESATFTGVNGLTEVAVTLADAEIPNWQAGLTPEQIDAAVEAVAEQVQQYNNSARLTPQQRETLVQQFSAPSQSYLAPSPTIPAVKQQLNTSFINADGGLYVNTNSGSTSGYIQIDAKGNVTASGSFTSGGLIGAGGTGIPSEAFTILGMVALVAFLSLALGILLLIAGIMMLRDAPVARKLHIIYGWLGLALAVISTLCVAWLVATYMLDTTYRDPEETLIGVLMILGTLVVGGAYPLAVLLVLRTRTMRDYYAGVT